MKTKKVTMVLLGTALLATLACKTQETAKPTETATENSTIYGQWIVTEKRTIYTSGGKIVSDSTEQVSILNETTFSKPNILTNVQDGNKNGSLSDDKVSTGTYEILSNTITTNIGNNKIIREILTKTDNVLKTYLYISSGGSQQEFYITYKKK